MRFIALEKSMTTATFTVWPLGPVPQPRDRTGAPWWRQAATVASTSCASRGMTTQIGTWR
jgi:hypothetical protein